MSILSHFPGGGGKEAQKELYSVGLTIQTCECEAASNIYRNEATISTQNLIFVTSSPPTVQELISPVLKIASPVFAQEQEIDFSDMSACVFTDNIGETLQEAIFKGQTYRNDGSFEDNGDGTMTWSGHAWEARIGKDGVPNRCLNLIAVHDGDTVVLSYCFRAFDVFE